MTADTHIDFPSDFPIKIIGNNRMDFKKEIVEIVLKHFPDTLKTQFIYRDSKQATYLSITVTVYALDKGSLDALYRELTQHPDIKMVL